MITEPTTDRGKATVARVLEAACDLFARQGVRATTLDDIGAAAGVGRGQLYHFFAGKADLVADVVAFQVEQVLSSVRPSFDVTSTAADVRRWCAEAVRMHASSRDRVRCPIGSLVYELDGGDDGAARAALKAGFARWEEVFTDGFRRLAANGELSPGSDPAVLAAGLLAAYQGGMLLADISGDVGPLRHALDTVLAAALPAKPNAKSRKRTRAVAVSPSATGADG